jgi:hypothetical protein
LNSKNIDVNSLRQLKLNEVVPKLYLSPFIKENRVENGIICDIQVLAFI